MSNHYGDFHVVDTDRGIEINSVSDPSRWVTMPHVDFYRMVRDCAHQVATRRITCPVCSGTRTVPDCGTLVGCPMCKSVGWVTVDESRVEPVPWAT